MSIEILNVSKRFHQKKVLNGINLKIQEKQIIGLIGPSGAGKTTLIRMIIGSLKIDAGEIIIDNINVPNKNLYKNIGFMPQSEALYLDLSGIDNLKFFGRLYGLKKKELKQRCEYLLKLIDLESEQHKLVEKYSGGMKKRLSLIIALLHNPDYLILDEPTVGIDPLLRKKIWEEFINLANSDKTIIISTHVMDEALKCHKCAMISHGHVLAYDTVQNLLKQSNNDLEQLFLQGENK